jgi:hypothetical protein
MRFFFPDANTWLQHLPAFSGDQVRATIVVLVAACAYCLGRPWPGSARTFSMTMTFPFP